MDCNKQDMTSPSPLLPYNTISGMIKHPSPKGVISEIKDDILWDEVIAAWESCESWD